MKTRYKSLLIIGILLFIPNSVYACSCGAYPDFLSTWMESSGAFQGTVKNIQTDEGPQKITFDIHQVQKGIYPYGNYTLLDSSVIHYGDDMWSLSSCAVDYKIGETFQVFTFGQNLGEINMCSTKQISGFDKYSHEDENSQMQHYRQDYNFFIQYNLLSLIVPVSITSVIVGIIIWKKRK